MGGGKLVEPTWSHGNICIEGELWYRRHDMHNLSKDKVDEILRTDPDWCSLAAIRKEVKRVSKGTTWSNVDHSNEH